MSGFFRADKSVWPHETLTDDLDVIHPEQGRALKQELEAVSEETRDAFVKTASPPHAVFVAGAVI